MAKGIFIKYRGSMTLDELNKALEGMNFRENSIRILTEFFVEGKKPSEIGPRNRVNNSIDQFLKSLAEK